MTIGRLAIHCRTKKIKPAGETVGGGSMRNLYALNTSSRLKMILLLE